MFELTMGQSVNKMTTQNTANLLKKYPPPYLIVGMGKSGSATKRLLLTIGVPSSSIFTFDDKAAADYQDPSLALKETQPKTLVVSPGYHLKKPWIVQAKQNGLQITSELTLASFYLSSEKVIGVTGSVGKSTVCALLGSAFDELREPALVCGNFGFPLADYAADVLEKKIAPYRWLVVELSSYQLENCEGLSLSCGVLTSLTPNHLERYLTKDHYYASKLALFRMSSKFKICGTQSNGLFAFLNELAQGHHLQALEDMGIQDLSFLNHLLLAEQSSLVSDRWASQLGFAQKFFDLSKTMDLHLGGVKNQRLIGQHNLINILICMAVFRCFGFSDQADHALLNFPGLAHRLENLGENNQILFINDSKATTLESVITASKTLQSSYPQRTSWLLIGGKDKNLPWQDLSSLQSLPQLRYVFFGECGRLAHEKSQLPGQVYSSLKSALADLKTHLLPGHVVLLSPGGTSFDEFKSFEDRGNFFKTWVKDNFSSEPATLP